MANGTTLDKLFGSRIRVKLLRFLFRNYPGNFSVAELSKKIQEPSNDVEKELNFLSELKVIKKNRT